MFVAARVSAARHVQRAAVRSFTTSIVESGGVKVASVDNHNTCSSSSTSSVTVFVKAGSRYEPKEGVANALKNFAFKSTAKRTTLGTVRESEIYGGVLSSSLGREHFAVTAEFLRGDEDFFVDVLASFITSSKLTRHEFAEYVVPLISADTAAAVANPAVRAVELAHAVAFRKGLAASLYAPVHPTLTLKDVQDYAKRVFAKGNLAVVGAGIDQARLGELVGKAFASASAVSGEAAGAAADAKTIYFGGENRVEGAGGAQAAFIGYGVVAAPSAELATLAAYLSPAPSVKWSETGLSPLSGEAIPRGASVEVVYLPYSDASLVGLVVKASTPEGVKETGKVCVGALRRAAVGIGREEVAAAVAKAKFAAASRVDGRAGMVDTIGAQIFGGGASSLAAFDAVDASAFTKAVSSLVASKPTYVAVGDVGSLPYADELGL